MQTEVEHPEAKHADLPSYFVVEIKPGLFAICARTMVLEPGPDDFSRALIEGYLEKARLRAAPLPGWTGGGCDPCGPQAMSYNPQTGSYLAKAGPYSPQTGRVVININASDTAGKG